MGVPIGGDAMKIQDFANVITVLLVVIVVVSDVWITKSVQAKLLFLKFASKDTSLLLLSNKICPLAFASWPLLH